ncbi:NACHT domain-containing protein [Pseudarthrobacter sp. lyk4-40-TYG-27]|uniref:NACHT domain-containing protein n=1 Tax=Pseudarthrobacter sp. lyk4-40-TYG-27 TaxID=3040305 RepID=UPI002554A319|nr:NACHT domain-containing protein [Pseudarthrobacter sp. lyk4-40-TYG-27]
MDPITIGAAGLAAVKASNATVTGAKNAANGLQWAIRKLRLYGKYDPEWLDLGLDSASLTAAQAADVHSFLASARAQPVLRFVALSMLIPTSEGHSDIQEAMKEAFSSEAKRWLIDSNEKWSDAIASIWDRLCLMYKGLIRPLDNDPALVAEAENYTRFLSLPLGTPINANGVATHYLNRLTELAGNLEQLFSSGSTSAHLAQLIRASGYGQIINHIDVSNIEFQNLYVRRHFNDSTTGQTIESEALVTSENPFRVVLKGSPGAGKTTFVSHFVHAIASPREDGIGTPSAVIRCRDYAGSAWSSALTDYAAQKLAAELSTTLSSAQLEAMLLTGQIVVVFDGLDEITEKTQRSEMVQRIQAFTAQYPPVSVLVTTRAVGYERAPVDGRLFRHLELREFSEDQVLEYATKWFTHAARPELIESFIMDSDSVSDLRINPLLLSLLCNLYKNSGEIPVNRREIYEECAQLLFKRWDAHRQIQVPHSMPKFANQLMREIARWFYTSQSAQSGVEERQIAQTIANYMVDDIGMSIDEAREAAKEFLNFCADRAWLLGSTGTSAQSQRLYSFTHRTFFEFFTAEAFARASDASAASIAMRIREAYERDSTSVLPELLIQSYHSVRERGATHVFEELCKAGSPPTPTLLLLRLLDGAVLAKYALVAGFNLLRTRWTSSEYHISASEFLALLSVNPVARSLFVENFLLVPDGRAMREIFFSLWANYQLFGGRRYEESWTPDLQKVLDAFAEELSGYEDECVLNWLLILGREAAEPESPWEYIRTGGVIGPADGIISWLIKRGEPDKFTSPQKSAIDAVHDMITRGTWVPIWVLNNWTTDSDFVPSPLLSWSNGAEVYTQKLRDILAVLLLASYEEKHENGHMLASELCWPGRISSVAAYRDWKHGVGPKPNMDIRHDAVAVIEVLPPHVRRWAAGGRYLVEDSRLD